MSYSIDSPKPVTILTGFLGAGKTSFLNQWLAFKKASRIFVVENEIGKVNVDTHLVLAPDDQIFDITGGCICCGLSEDFGDLLETLWERRAEYDELVIEATGVADPEQILRPFKLLASTEKYFKVERIVCLVDPNLIVSELANTDIAKRQIAFSDTILIGKTDIVAANIVADVMNMLQEINPFAMILQGNILDGYPMSEILGHASFDNEKLRRTPTEKITKSVQHNMSTLYFAYDKPFVLKELRFRLLVLLSFQKGDVYRIKGILHLHDSNERVVVQSVGETVNFTSAGTWENDIPKTEIVIIGKNLRIMGFEKLFENCLAQAH